LTFDGQFDRDDGIHTITLINGLAVAMDCASASTEVDLSVSTLQPSLYGWGTQWNGSALSHSSVSNFGDLLVVGNNTAELDVVAQASPGPGVTPGYTHIDVSGVVGTKCNYHALIIPPS
jgi:hypothetical protein